MSNKETALVKPLPIPDGDSEVFWKALKTNKLLLQNCIDCGHIQYYQQAICRLCQSKNLEHLQASGRGTIHSYSVVYRAPSAAFKEDVPYAVLLVDLEEGPRMISKLVGNMIDQLDFDKAVRLKVVQVSDDVYLPCFELDKE